MQTIENRDQFLQEAQQLLRQLEERINDMARAGTEKQEPVSEDVSNEMNRLKNQRQNLQEAMERFGNQNAAQWSAVKTEAAYTLSEIANTWRTSTTNAWSADSKQTSKWQVSTGQSDHGEMGIGAGLGDRGGMEDPQTGLDNTTQYSSFGNPYDEEEQERPRHKVQEEQTDSESQSDQNNQGRTRRQGNPDDWKTNKDSGTVRSSYEKMEETNRKQQNEPKDQEKLSRTNIGGEATQDDPGGSADKEEKEEDYNTPQRKR